MLESVASVDSSGHDEDAAGPQASHTTQLDWRLGRLAEQDDDSSEFSVAAALGGDLWVSGGGTYFFLA